MIRQSICIFPFIAISYLSTNTFGQLLNCSELLKDSGSEAKLMRRGIFYQSILHDCFRAHPYNIQQLPLPLDIAKAPLKVSYIVSIFNLLELLSQGTLNVMADINFRWTDSYRKWNTSQIPVEKIQIPAKELWYPKFSLSNCKGDICVMRPDDDTLVTIASNGKVSMTVTRKLAANCDVTLKYFPVDKQCCLLSFHMYVPKYVIIP